MDKALKKTAKDIMTKPVITVKEGDMIKEVFGIMDKKKVMGLPVVDGDNQVVGIITESDLIQHFTTLEAPTSVNLLGAVVYLEDTDDFNEDLKDHAALMVKDLMTAPVITVEESTSLQEVIDIMSEKSKIRLPVVNKANKLVGIITRMDIVHQLAKVKDL